MRVLLYVEAAPMEGDDVKAWQEFLIPRLGLSWSANGRFGPKTKQATELFQSREGLGVDGEVGHNTLERAKQLGFVEPAGAPQPQPQPRPTQPSPRAPGADPSLAQPGFAAPTRDFTERNFGGRYAYRDTPGRDEIVITDGWESRNLQTVTIPQLNGIPLYSHNNTARASGRARFNRRGTDRLVALWRAWDDAGLVGRILTYSGAFEARYMRGSRRRQYLDLSNHAYGTAFDINYEWNRLGHDPAAMGAQGCVRELVQIANQHGFYWGGHYANRKDGMHFELAEL